MNLLGLELFMKALKKSHMIMNKFASYIRSGDSLDYSIKLYSSLVRTHIWDVLENTYPYFNKYAQEGTKTDLVEFFMQNHSAKNPVFHTIATELLEASKKCVFIDEILLILMEFEWLIYATEIADLNVKRVESFSFDMNISGLFFFDLNPTLSFIMLPFSLDKLKFSIESLRGRSKCYAIYRNQFSKVLSLEIDYHDYIFLKGQQFFVSKNNCENDMLLDRVKYFHEHSLISQITKGTYNDSTSS